LTVVGGGTAGRWAVALLRIHGGDDSTLIVVPSPCRALTAATTAR
jgi:hypothetical protein